MKKILEFHGEGPPPDKTWPCGVPGWICGKTGPDGKHIHATHGVPCDYGPDGGICDACAGAHQWAFDQMKK